MEKRLSALLEESKENRRKHLEKKYAVRYHKVRFFERIKVERKIKKLQNALKATLDDSLKEELIKAQEDLEYILHFPKGEKYVSLLKDAEDPEAQKHLESERKRLRLVVKQHLRDEAIVNELNEGIPSAGPADASAKPVESASASESESDIEHDDFFAQSLEESDHRGAMSSDSIQKDSPQDESLETTSSCRSEPDTGEKQVVENEKVTEENDVPWMEEESDEEPKVDLSSPNKPQQRNNTIASVGPRLGRSMSSDRRSTRHGSVSSRTKDLKIHGVNSKQGRTPAKVANKPLQGKRSSSRQTSEQHKANHKKQPLRSRAEGGRKRKKKKS